MVVKGCGSWCSMMAKELIRMELTDGYATPPGSRRLNAPRRGQCDGSRRVEDRGLVAAKLSLCGNGWTTAVGTRL